MFISLDVDSITEFSSPRDIEEIRTIFLLGQLDSHTRSFLDDYYSDIKKDEGGIDIPMDRANMKIVDIVSLGLKGWKNFKNSKGDDVEFKTEEKIYPIIGKRIVASAESMNKLDRFIHWELVSAIVKMNTLTEEDKKK